MTRALITGITGQDGSYLAELLLDHGAEVHGIVRRTSRGEYPNLAGILDRITLHYGDMTTETRLAQIVADVRPTEVYNLAAQSDVGASFSCPEYTMEVNAVGVVRLLMAVQRFAPTARVYQASTSELFGNEPAPQNEQTRFEPRSPYAAAKLAAHNVCRNYREAYGMHVSCGILFNHESPRRGLQFVTRKIARAAARREMVRLGNIDPQRDWGYAPDYVEGMWLMLQQDEPGDYVIATGETHSVEEFAAAAYAVVGLDYKDYVETDPAFVRPSEVHELRGDATRAREELGWRPGVAFEDLVTLMVDAEKERVI